MKRLPDLMDQIQELTDFMEEFEVQQMKNGAIVRPKSSSNKKALKKKKVVKPKVPRKRLLCKVKVQEEDYEGSDTETLFVYRDGTARWDNCYAEDINSYFKWKLAHSEFGPMLLKNDTDYDGDEYWECTWMSNDKREIAMAEGIAKALADLEMEKLLKGEHE